MTTWADVDDIRTGATILASQGYPGSAARLRAIADQLATQSHPPDVEPWHGLAAIQNG